MSTFSKTLAGFVFATLIAAAILNSFGFVSLVTNLRVLFLLSVTLALGMPLFHPLVVMIWPKCPKPPLGQAPFRSWLLYASPLTFIKFKRSWPTGLPYVRVTYVESETGLTHCYLMLDNLAEPMAIGGLTFYQLPTLLKCDQQESREEIAKFFFLFLKWKHRFSVKSKRWRVSNRWLGPLAFPTACVHLEPKVSKNIEEFVGLDVVMFRCPSQINDFYFSRSKNTWPMCEETIVASYRWDGERAVESKFDLSFRFKKQFTGPFLRKMENQRIGFIGENQYYLAVKELMAHRNVDLVDLNLDRKEEGDVSGVLVANKFSNSEAIALSKKYNGFVYFLFEPDLLFDE